MSLLVVRRKDLVVLGLLSVLPSKTGKDRLGEKRHLFLDDEQNFD